MSVDSYVKSQGERVFCCPSCFDNNRSSGLVVGRVIGLVV